MTPFSSRRSSNRLGRFRGAILGAGLLAAIALHSAAAQTTDPAVVDLSITGPSDNRVDMVFVADDYFEDEMDTFAADVDRIKGDLFTISPLSEYRGYFNVRRIDIAPGDDKLVASHARQKAALERLEPDQHEMLMLVSNRESAGVAWTLSWVDPDGNSRWTGVAWKKGRQAWNHKVFAHELAHSFARLDDEFDGKCWDTNAPNISATSDRETLKWAHWIGVDGYGGTDLDPEDTPVPASTEMYSYYSGRTVSAYRCPNGNWRPTWKSIMRYATAAGERFDPVSREQIIKRFHAFVRPIDRALPEEEVVTPTSCDSVRFEVQAPDVDTLVARWRVDGEDAAAGRYLDVRPCNLDPGTHTIDVEVVDETPHVRARDGDSRMDPATRSWNLNVNVANITNTPPYTVGTLPDQVLQVEDRALAISLDGIFQDPDNDELTYGASSSAVSVATVSVTGSMLSVTPLSAGTAVVTVTATDVDGSNTGATQAFEVRVANRAPEPVGTLPALLLRVSDAAWRVNVSGAFEDPDGDALTYGALSSDESVATVSVAGSTVWVTPVSAGESSMTVTAADEGGLRGEQPFAVTVVNQPPVAVGSLPRLSLEVSEGAAFVDVSGAFRDPEGDALTYEASSSAVTVVAVAMAGGVVEVTPLSRGTATVAVTATDLAGSNTPAVQRFGVSANGGGGGGGGVVDYDADADGLIEVRTLAQLDAMRHDLDGDGAPSAAGEAVHGAAFEGALGGLSCAGGCRGYELVADLDFDTNDSGGPDAGDAYWRNGSGWLPIGTEAEPFDAAFEGNGRVIRRLFVAGGEGAGLFGATGASSVVARVGLIAADVAGTQAVGALAGVNGGRVTACWATGRVSGSAAAGGLVGVNDGDLAAVYATGRVSGSETAGGLVGLNRGTLTASYATGRVRGASVAGGLVGLNRGTLTASYATGRVRGASVAGGLVGAIEPPGTVTASYWDTDTSGVASSAAGRGLTTSALQRPTAYGGLYAAWNVDVDGDGVVDGPWHLGTSAQYPALTLDVDGDGLASRQELGRQLRAGPALTAVPAAMPAEVVLTWTMADTGAWMPVPEVAYTVTRESGSAVETVAAGVRGARYVDADVQPGSSYTYQVAAVVDGGEAARSALVTAEVPCAFTVTPLHRDVLWTAGEEQVAVTTAPGCAWTAASESGFLALTAGAARAGPGTVRYTVGANAGGPRRGALAVAGQRVTVYQASPTVFTDHPIERGVTPVKAIHFLELRARIDALRAGRGSAAGRPAFGWTDPVLTPRVTPIRRVHLTELRAALSEAYAAAGRAAPVYTDPAVTAGATAIRAAHLMELRAAVAALE